MDLRQKTPLNTYQYLVNTDNEMLYDGTGSILGSVIKGVTTDLINSSFTTFYNGTVNQTIGIPQASQSHCNLKVNNTLYGGSWSRQRFVFNDPDNDLTNFTQSAFTQGSSTDFISDAAYSEYTQSVFYISSTKLYKVDIWNFTSESILYDGNPISLGSPGSLPSLQASESYLFVGTANSPPFFLKISMSGQVVQSQQWNDPNFNGNVNGIHASTISPDKQWVYFGAPGGTNGDAIAKVNTNDITNYTSSGPIFKYINDLSSSFGMSDDIVYLNGYIYGVSEAGISSGSISYFGSTFKVDANTLITSSDNRNDGIGNSFGIFTDGTHLYKCYNNNGTIVYLNGDLNSPRIFTYQSASVNISPNEMWFTDGGKIIVSDWPGTGIQWVSFPYVQVGVGTVPSRTLDVAGDLYVSERIASPVVTTTTLNTNTEIFTQSINSYDNRITIRMIPSPRIFVSGSITGSAGISCPPAFKTVTYYHSSSINPTSSIAIKATNSDNYFTLAIFDNGDGTGTLNIVRYP